MINQHTCGQPLTLLQPYRGLSFSQEQLLYYREAVIFKETVLTVLWLQQHKQYIFMGKNLDEIPPD